MGVKEDFMADFDTDYEKALPEEFINNYYIIERLSVTENCDTLLVQKKSDGTKHVAKCYLGNEISFESSGAKLISQIDSRSIPHYEKEFQNERYRCIIREYVEGITLAEYAKTNILTRENIIRLAMELAGIMKLLHESDPVIIHRDIKPENIIIRKDQSLVLIDFGISRVYKKEGTSDTIFCGTRNFAPPEQYGFMQTDIRSDIYSFGVVLSWLLTGKEEPIRHPEIKLERIAAKCCAYAPEQRYQNDTALLKDLNKTTEKHAVNVRKKRRNAVITALACAVLLVFAGIYGQIRSQKAAYHFHESAIEDAVRLSLDRPKGVITKEDLLEVKEIYMFADEAYENMDEYYIGQEAWYASDERIHGKTESLIDIKYMKNLQILYMGGMEIEDLSPLRRLDKLESVSLQENAFHDISPLSDKPALQELYLVGNKLDNIEPVRTWPIIRDLSLHETGDYDGSPLADLKGMGSLDVFHGPDISAYMDGLYVEWLRVGWSGQTDLDCIKKVSHVEELFIDRSTIRDISALEGREDIVYLNMDGCAPEDLSPLFTMPNLTKVEMSMRQEEEMEELAKKYGEPSFEIIYTR